MSKFVAVAFTLAVAAGTARADEAIPNPLIDYDGFQRIVASSKDERESHRLSEAAFLARMREPGVVVLAHAKRVTGCATSRAR